MVKSRVGVTVVNSKEKQEIHGKGRRKGGNI